MCTPDKCFIDSFIRARDGGELARPRRFPLVPLRLLLVEMHLQVGQSVSEVDFLFIFAWECKA